MDIRMTMKNGVSLVALSLLLAACASAPKEQTKNTDKAAAERSKIYLESIEVSDAADSSAVCAVPAGLEKAFSPAQGASAQWKDLMARASKCAVEKGWKSLDTIAQTMSRLDINSPWGPYFMSVVATERGDWARALWMIDLAEKKAGVKVGLFAYQRGRIHLTQKETSKAMTEFEKAVSLDPRLIDGAMFLGDIHYRDHEWKEAAQSYAMVLQRKPSNYRALIGLAESKFRSGELKEAATLYVKAIDADSRQLSSWLRLGEIYEGLKDNELALSTYRDLRRAIDGGSIKQRPSFDLNSKIKNLESVVKPPERSQASVKPVDEKRSKK